MGSQLFLSSSVPASSISSLYGKVSPLPSNCPTCSAGSQNVYPNSNDANIVASEQKAIGAFTCSNMCICATDGVCYMIKTPTTSAAFYPFCTGYSHLQFNGAIADALVDAGHIVHIFIPDWIPDLKTNGSTKAQKVTRYAPSNIPKIRHTKFLLYPFDYKEIDFNEFHNTTEQFCNDIISDDILLDELRAEKYDIAITEFLDSCTPGIFEAIGVKAKIFTEATPMLPWLTVNWGIPSFDGYIPNPTKAPISTPNLSYIERAKNFFQNFLFKLMAGRITTRMTAKFRARFGDKFPEVRQIIQNVSFAFVNAIDVIELPRPITSKVINIGGINMREPKKDMPHDMKEIFFLAKKGVVLFSLGSIVNTTLMPEAQKWAFIKAFEQFPDYNFVWKVDQEDPMYRTRKNFSNVFPITWVDQTTFLAQPKLKLFVSHCGQNSLTEAAYSGTPILSVPIFADQQYNAAQVRRLGIGEVLEFEKITAEVLIEALDKMLTYNRYQQKADELMKKLLTHPRGDPKELVVKYVEYAAANPDLSSMNLPSTNLDFITLYCIDVIVPALMVLGLIVFGLLKLTLPCVVGMWRRKEKFD
ncbi:hypothetical protein QR680_015808 [Steinernema hermaphroditum]|uniref:glucuronosyltransferase n=1 Tax=Steinernema hermaphroditum TaxID=289476 RepID=A0AA39LL82_9BILA|nr:hypothetical protein QR680_015808 [Steinernema hermaphroditum]